MMHPSEGLALLDDLAVPGGGSPPVRSGRPGSVRGAVAFLALVLMALLALD